MMNMATSSTPSPQRTCAIGQVLVGGAPITEDYAREIGADGYAGDASSAVDLLCQLLEV